MKSAGRMFKVLMFIGSLAFWEQTDTMITVTLYAARVNNYNVWKYSIIIGITLWGIITIPIQISRKTTGVTYILIPTSIIMYMNLYL